MPHWQKNSLNGREGILKKNERRQDIRMILNTLFLSNYKQYSHLELEFREGLVGIIGKNGAGKSTLFEAILYCLFGRDEGNKAHVRTAFADPKANVVLELTFSIGEIYYRVRREFRGKTLTVNAELYKNDTLVAKGVSPVNDELVKVLHMERDAFKRSVFSGQKELSELSDTSGEARKKMVRRMLGLDTLDEVQIRVNAELRDLSSQAAGQRQNLLDETAIGNLKMEMEELVQRLEENQRTIAAETQKLQEIQGKYRTEKEKFDREEGRFKQHSTLQNELAQTRERSAGLHLQHTQLKGKEADLGAQIKALELSRPAWEIFEQEKKRLETLDKDHTRYLNRQARLVRIAEAQEQLQTLLTQLHDLSEQLAAHPQIIASLAEQQKVVAILEEAIKAKLNEHHEISQQIGGIEASIRERNEKLASLRALGKSGNCPTCMQPLLEGYEKALEVLETEIGALQNQQLQALENQRTNVREQGKNLREQQEAARNQVEQRLQEQTRFAELVRQQQTGENQRTQLEARIAADEAILQEIGEVQFDEALYQQLKVAQAAKEPEYRAYLSQENYVAREWPVTLEALQKTEAGMLEAEKKAIALNDSLQKIGYNEPAYLLAKQSVTDFAEAFQAQTEVLRSIEKIGLELEGEQARCAEKLRTNERIQQQISHKLEEVELLRKLAEMLGLFKTEILEKVSPGISREASDLFSRITKGKYEGILVDENFDFSIADGGVYYPIERFSGGEVDLANFCLRIAITKAIMDLSGSGQRLEFLAFDEIFGSQDEERRLEMMLALHYLQEQFRQIYIVSHIDSLKDYFPHLLEVQFGAEGSMALWR
ncbi:MAG: SMC family ATPase [Saprospiraceae bacterium]|nr:SMC family ATPase [Saprospiraceae bacterium]